MSAIQARWPYPRDVARPHDQVMRVASGPRFVGSQIAIVVGAIVAYFGVRGITEGDAVTANRNASTVVDIERAAGIYVEEGLQRLIAGSDTVVTLSNWTYIWMHWPVIAITLIWFIRSNRDRYVELRNAMIISGLIGLIIFATFPVAPPRLYGTEFIDTVTDRSYSYRVLQPPMFVNAYAAVPSLHFGWNLLIGVMWFRVGGNRRWRVASVIMPAGMAWAVVATANHWVFDVLTGGAVALCGLAIEHTRRQGGIALTAAEVTTDSDAVPLTNAVPAGDAPRPTGDAASWQYERVSS
jgi:hypothetical protein